MTASLSWRRASGWRKSVGAVMRRARYAYDHAPALTARRPAPSAWALARRHRSWSTPRSAPSDRVAGGPDEVHLAIKDVDHARRARSSCSRAARTTSTRSGAGTSRRSRRRRSARSSRRSTRTPRARAATTARWWSCSARIRARASTRTSPDSSPGASRPITCSRNSRGISRSAGARCSSDSWRSTGRSSCLGSDHDKVTFLHYAEHIGDFPGKQRRAVQGAGAGERSARVALAVGVRHVVGRRAPELAGALFRRHHRYVSPVDGQRRRAGRLGALASVECARAAGVRVAGHGGGCP